MRVLRKRAFSGALRLLRDLEKKQFDAQIFLTLNKAILKQVIDAEEAVTRHVQTKKQLRADLKSGRNSKISSRLLKAKISKIDGYIQRQSDQIFIWKCFGDAIAHLCIPSENLKQVFFDTEEYKVKPGPGKLGGKAGLKGELAFLKSALDAGVPAVLSDITNCIRYGDVCLLGGSDPYPIEVKTSERLNQRGRRQLAKLDTLHGFLRSDEAKNFRGNLGRTDRFEFPVHQRTFRQEFNDCLCDAKARGFGYASPESCVSYLAVRSDQNIQECLERNGVISDQVIYYLNIDMVEQNWAPYVPFILSVRSEDLLHDFIEGRIHMFVTCDFRKGCASIADEDFWVRFNPSHSNPVQFLDVQTKSAWVVGRTILDRIAFEQASMVDVLLGTKLLVKQAIRDSKSLAEVGSTAAERSQTVGLYPIDKQTIEAILGNSDDDWAKFILAAE